MKNIDFKSTLIGVFASAFLFTNLNASNLTIAGDADFMYKGLKAIADAIKYYTLYAS